MAMTATTNNDLQRDMGRVEASLDSLEKLVAKGFDDIKGELHDLKKDVSELKLAESQRKGAFSLGQWLVGAIGAGIALIAQHFWK